MKPLLIAALAVAAVPVFAQFSSQDYYPRHNLALGVGAALPKGVSEDRPKDVNYTVAEIYPDHLVLDGNHPLAGIAIRLDITVRSVREATEEEVGSGTAGTAFFKVPPTAPGNDLLH